VFGLVELRYIRVTRISFCYPELLKGSSMSYGGVETGLVAVLDLAGEGAFPNGGTDPYPEDLILV
jgi:hypothetical protein